MLVLAGAKAATGPAAAAAAATADTAAHRGIVIGIVVIGAGIGIVMHLLNYEPHNEDHAHSEKLIVNYEGT